MKNNIDGEVLEFISNELSVPVDVVNSGLAGRYKKISFPKRNGGNRIALHPVVELKMIQNWLISTVFSKFPVSEISMAYRKGYSILNNAKRHKNSKYFIRVDIKNFFESISFEDFSRVLEKNTSILPDFVCQSRRDSFFRIIEKSCFVGPHRNLPIGFVSSPVISNIVMKDFDDNLVKVIDEDCQLSYGVVTRYADDFIFSSNKKGACHRFLEVFEGLLKETRSPKLVINKEKTSFMSKNGGGAMVTGLLINSDSNVVLNRKYRDKIRLMLSLFDKGKLKEEDRVSLVGHLSYISCVDPAFYTRLSFKYCDAINRVSQ